MRGRSRKWGKLKTGHRPWWVALWGRSSTCSEDSLSNVAIQGGRRPHDITKSDLRSRVVADEDRQKSRRVEVEDVRDRWWLARVRKMVESRVRGSRM